MNKILEQIGLLGILPVAVMKDADQAEAVSRRLAFAGIPAIEVTFRTQAAARIIERIAANVPEMLVGAGTVLTVDQARVAVASGAKFIVSPGLSPKVVEFCIGNSVPVIPGVATPTEVTAAMQYDLEVVKFFPAEASGGVQYLRAMAAAFGEMRYVPTGGIDQSNLLSYLRFRNVHACGGSWMLKSDLLDAGNFDEIERLSRHAVDALLGFEVKHVGINTPDAAEAGKIVATLENTFHFSSRETPGSFFTGAHIEVLKRQYLGAHGHLAVGTNFIDRAIHHLSLKGVGIKPDTKNMKDGKLVSVYLDLDLGGFAVHLLQS